MVRTKEEIAAYKREWYQNNKEKHLARMKEWRGENKDKVAVFNKKYRDNNKEKVAETNKKYDNTPAGIKMHKLAKWKNRGLICEDVDSLYCDYLNATNCDECGVVFGTFGDGSGTFKCLDHSHESGKFRNFLCLGCNTRRGEHNL